jgi:GMP synthase-like glutamine amidotransferase
VKRALLIEHDAFTRPGLVGEALEARGYQLVRRVVVPEDRFDSPDVDHDYPEPEEFDLVVPMGAPWSVDDDARIGTWIAPELAMLRRGHEAGVPVLGICFGGQAMSVALGGGVTRAPGWEIGWGEITTSDPGLVPAGPWFQFHEDAMVPPPGSLEIACSRPGAAIQCSQAWTLGRTLAVQFHPELTAELLEIWLANGGTAVIAREGLDVEQMRAATLAGKEQAGRRTQALVHAFLDQVAGRPR